MFSKKESGKRKDVINKIKKPFFTFLYVFLFYHGRQFDRQNNYIIDAPI